MATTKDNIFDAQRDRRIAILQQQSVSNVVKNNPNLRGVLSRYEDAEVSRLKLLELQRLRNKKITKGERALLKAVTKGRRGRGGGLRQGKQKKQKETKPAEPPKSQTQIEVDAEEKRRKLKQQDRFLELEDLKQQREFVRADRDRTQRELQRQTLFISGQNKIAADAQIAIFNQQQENLRAGQRDIQRIQDRQLDEDRLELQRRKIDNQFEINREQRALEYRRIDADTDRFNADVRRAEVKRDRDIAIADRQLADLRERVARDDAFRHAQLQETQRLAFEQLAEQRRDNTAQRELERRRIDNQRAVDAERAITDREKEQSLQAVLTASRFQGPPQKLTTDTPVRLQRRAEFLQEGDPEVIDIATQEEKQRLERFRQGQQIPLEKQPEQFTPRTVSTEQSSSQVRLEVASEASSSSSESSLADPELRRARNIQDRIARGTPTFTTKEGEVKPKFSEGERERIKARAEKRAQRTEQEPETLITGQGQVEELQEGDTLRTGD